MAQLSPEDPSRAGRTARAAAAEGVQVLLSATGFGGDLDGTAAAPRRSALYAGVQTVVVALVITGFVVVRMWLSGRDLSVLAGPRVPAAAWLLPGALLALPWAVHVLGAPRRWPVGLLAGLTTTAVLLGAALPFTGSAWSTWAVIVVAAVAGAAVLGVVAPRAPASPEPP